MYRRLLRNRVLRTGVFLVAVLTAATAVEGALVTGSQPVTGHGQGGTSGWDYSYTRTFDGEQMVKDVQIDFTFFPGLTDEAKDSWREAAKASIEGLWNNRYVIRYSGGYIPLAVDVTFDGPFNQEVTVWEDDAGPTTPPDPPRTDMLNWHWSDSASINAHEFGHMLGLYDEYAGGWQDPANPLNLADTLMGWGALTPNPTMRPEYFQQYLDYFSELNPYVEAELEQIPEPGALAIFVILCGAAVAWGRAARRR